MRWGTSTGTTSSPSLPSSQAAWARRWLRAAHASWSSREIFRSSLTSSESSPISCPVKVEYRPSWTMESTSFASPSRTPQRAPGRRYGAPLIDSMPPATATWISPARISWSARATALRPERQTLLIVIEGTSLGMPAATAACRAVICPVPAWMTWPMIT